MTGLSPLIVLWGSLGLLAYGAFCLSVAVRGLTPEATIELRIAFWTGRALIAVSSVALLLAVSKGMNELISWVLA